jgi:hypothetical protein
LRDVTSQELAFVTGFAVFVKKMAIPKCGEAASGAP